MKSIDYYTNLLLNKKDLTNPNNLEELGYIFYGPLVFNYLIWISQEVKDADLVLFNSREGYFLKRLYNILDFKLKLPKSVYFKTSRKISSISSFESKKDIYDSFKLHRYEGNLSHLLEYRFGLNIDLENDLYINTKLEIPNLDEYVDLILLKSKETNHHYKKYINKTLKNSKNVFMIDSGFQGSTQFYLKKAFGLNLKGRYMTYKGNIDLKDTYGFYDFKKCHFKDNIIFFESVFTDKVGSYVDINSKGFVNESNKFLKKTFNYNLEIVNGIENFIYDMLDNNFDLTQPPSQLPDYNFNLMCKKNFIKNELLFMNFFHDNLYTRSNTKKLTRT